ncbi:M14 family zinc carboxypeptidase [Pseudoalteromonas sp. YIC-656]|uniref:M14 family zinc carboxypeptidase n=1 Tax=Pseudoalteromonas pernae TaxID=3118054 RepID=UPI0032426AB4
MKLNRILASVAWCGAMLSAHAQATVLMKPTPLSGAQYPALHQGEYDSAITPAQDILGFDVGQRTATPEQINELVNLWAQQSEKAQIIEYARSYEGRALHYLVISSPKNLANLDNIKANIAKLSEPDSLSKAQIDQLIDETPGTAWMAYSIHGNESSGSDASLAFIYQLLAAKDPKVASLLDDLVILVDPMMNPDGRARFTKRLQENRGTAPNFDVQSLLHSGAWPFGRTNHYYYDLNRDFYFAVNPESKGRIKAINQWFPQLMIDAHEMGALDTFLMGPPREPLNVNIPSSTRQWSEVFADEQSGAFDNKNWPYYTGEWFENLYPGYSNYAEYKGSVHILYEQARTAEDGVRLHNGNIRTYKESVDHQYVSSLANLETLQKYSKAMYKDFVKNRLAHIDPQGKYGQRSFVILPTDNTSRLHKLLDILDLQGIEYAITTADIQVSKAKNHLGQVKATTIPKGSIVVQNRQYDAPLLATIMEFDAELKDSVLLEERQNTLRDGSSIMYDTTAWNVSMMYGLPALEVPQHLDRSLGEYQRPSEFGLVDKEGAIAYMVDGASDASVAFAARLLEQNVKVRVLHKKGLFDDQEFNRGSVVVNKYDNAMSDTQLKKLLDQTAKDVKVQALAVTRGLGKGDLPDIGGENFKLLTPPKIAFISQNGIAPGDIGSMWHLLDTELGIRHSHLNQEMLSFSDLRLYNVIIVPSRWYGELSKSNIVTLDKWIEAGGTLIVNGNSAAQLASAEEFSNVSLLKASFEKAGEYDVALMREWQAKQDTIANAELVNANTVSASLSFPWDKGESIKPMSKEQLEQWHDWTAAFMPSGAILAGRTDQKHWLSYGVTEQLPVLAGNVPLFMTKQGVDAVVRYGVMSENKQAEQRMIGWATVPQGQDLYVRMSGLLWPEAAQRMSNTVYLTREAKGNGQVIMFANVPNFRGATKGTARLLLNAIVYGPGLGTEMMIHL